MVDINVIKNSFVNPLNGSGQTDKDAISVFINGTTYNSWTDISINRDLDSAIGSFTMSFVDKWRQSGDSWVITPGQKIAIKIGNRKLPVLNGFVDSVEASISNTDRSISVTGRDRTCDLADCSYIEENEISSITFLGLCEKMAGFFGIDVYYESPLYLGPLDTPFKFIYQQGDSMLEALYKEGKPRGFNLKTDGEGNLVIFNRNASETLTRSPVALSQDGNILKASVSLDQSDRYSTYIVKGQSSNDALGWGLKKNTPKGSADDRGVTRTRPLVVISDTEVDDVTAQTQAEQEADIRKRQSNDISAEVQGWTKTPLGELWSVGDIVPVDAGFIGISNVDLLIKSIGLSKSTSGGTITTIGMTTPDSFRNEKTKTSGNDLYEKLGWKFTSSISKEKALELSPKL